MADTKKKKKKKKKNALARLAVRLGSDVLSLGGDKYPEIVAAQRIVAELAKVEDIKEFGIVHVREDMAIDAVEKSRAIAEEETKCEKHGGVE